MVQRTFLRSDALIEKRGEVVSRFVDGKVVLLCPESFHPFRLNESGARIWSLMAHPRRVGDLVDELQGLYEVDREEVLLDVMAFLSELLERNLIEGR
jgi:hypothetical protein